MLVVEIEAWEFQVGRLKVAEVENGDDNADAGTRYGRWLDVRCAEKNSRTGELTKFVLTRPEKLRTYRRSFGELTRARRAVIDFTRPRGAGMVVIGVCCTRARGRLFSYRTFACRRDGGIGSVSKLCRAFLCVIRTIFVE